MPWVSDLLTAQDGLQRSLFPRIGLERAISDAACMEKR